MKLKRIKYSELNGKQKEIYNFQKVASELAEFGFNCIKLADDWQGADFLAYHKDGGDTLKVQLKARLTIDKKYQGKQIYITFPHKNDWYLIEHDKLVSIIQKNTSWLKSESWLKKGIYSSASPNKEVLNAIAYAKL